MALTRIILWLGNAFLFCAALMGLTALAGLVLGELPISAIFLFMMVFTSMIGGVLRFTSTNAYHQESTSDALIFLLLFWVFTPIIFALPYRVAGVCADFTHSYFEAVSAFTTTGATTLTPEAIPQTFLVWQSLLQWSGGVVGATFAVVILAALNLTGTGVHRSKLFTLKRGELFPRLIGIGRIIAAMYGVIAFVCFVLLALSGTPMLEAVCLALSAISTGGLTPQSGPMAGYVSRFGAVVLAVVCVFGAANVAVLWDLVRLKSRQYTMRFFSNSEHRGLFVLTLVLTSLGLFYGGLANVFPLFIEAVYMVTTAGFDYEVIGIDLLPPSVLIGAALIGGSAISTAGGIKIIRLLLLLSHAITDIDRMSHPSRVKLVHFRGQILPDHSFLSIWMYFFGYTMFFAAGTVALGLADLPYTAAVAACAAALSNMGPLLGATFPEMLFSDMSKLQLSLLSIIMLVGRVEVLAALAAFSPSLWRR